MALYLPAGRRRQRLIGGLALAAVLGLVLGFVLGRVTASTASDDVSSVQDQARNAVGALQSTPTEYAQAAADSTEFANGGGVTDAIDRVNDDISRALADAPWLGPASRAAALTAVADVRRVAKAGGSPDEYVDAVATASVELQQIFGIDRAGQ